MNFILKGDERAGAVFSDCDYYRFELWRVWDAAKPAAMFIMLNPSTATHEKLDPTVTRCKGYAEAWGYGSMIVMNLFAWRATDPEDMKAAVDPVGQGNDEALVTRADEVISAGGIVIAAWGTHGVYAGRCWKVKAMFMRHGIKLRYLKLSKDGHPGHPLYLPKALRPQEWV